MVAKKKTQTFIISQDLSQGTETWNTNDVIAIYMQGTITHCQCQLLQTGIRARQLHNYMFGSSAVTPMPAH